MGSAAELYYVDHLNKLKEKQEIVDGLFTRVKTGEMTMNQAYRESNFKGTFAEFVDLAAKAGFKAPFEVVESDVSVVEVNKFPIVKIALIVGGVFLLYKTFKK
jgi:hypothetical protein